MKPNTVIETVFITPNARSHTTRGHKSHLKSFTERSLAICILGIGDFVASHILCLLFVMEISSRINEIRG